MDISNIANLINAIAVTAGVIFAAVQIRQYKKRRQRDAMLELVRSFQSPAFTAALRRVLSLPDGADAAKIREVLGPDGEDAVFKRRCRCFACGHALVVGHAKLAE